MLPPDVILDLQSGLLAVLEVAALAFIVIVGIAAFKYMRRAVGDDPWAGYTVQDDVHDRALEAHANRIPSDQGQELYWKYDKTRAARDVTRNQKYY